jgi:zinc transport system ATP-binding protein
MEPILKLTSVTAGYGTNRVLEDISLTVYENDFLAVIGPNGSGKTTLLKCMLGLLEPMKGKITYHGQLKGKRSIGYLPQFHMNDRMFPMTVENVILTGLLSSRRLLGRFSREEHLRARELMERMDLIHKKDESIGSLSGGQTQRVFLCRALISRPGMLVLDEPSTFVDSTTSRNLDETLKELNEKMAIVLVSHDMTTVLSQVKNIACLEGGHLHYHPREEFSRELIEKYHCPIQLIEHGNYPHIVLAQHDDSGDTHHHD